MRKSLAVVGVLALMVSTVAACTTNKGDDGSNYSAKQNQGAIGTAAQSKGPADPVKGAQKGGHINVLQGTPYDHLDFQNSYYVEPMELERLFGRQLTSYRVIKGKTYVVGDLATDPGKDVNGDCKTWKYTLKDGLKYEDGSTIKASDVAYGISRSFALTKGAQYFVQWLDGAKGYKGPWKDKGKIAPGITTKGNTITFKLSAAHCDMPYMASMNTSTPVPPKKDTKNPGDFDKRPFSSGPYKFASKWSAHDGVHLVKNTNWDPNTDPIRHQYLDKVNVNFGHTDKQNSNALKADRGDDQYSFTNTVDPSLVADFGDDPALKKRIVNEVNVFTYWMGINNEKIDDVEVRQALDYAIDKEDVVKAAGGQYLWATASTTLNPTVSGYKDLKDTYGGSKGDKKKAKAILKKKHFNKTLTYAYRDTPTGGAVAVNLQGQLKEVGIKLNLKKLNAKTGPDTLGSKKQNQYDLYFKNWGADWPTGGTTMGPIYDGRNIAAEGNVDNIWFNEDKINKKLTKIGGMTNIAKQNKAYGDLDEEIMKDYCPMVPLFYGKSFALFGSKIGGQFQSEVLGTTAMVNLYAKK